MRRSSGFQQPVARGPRMDLDPRAGLVPGREHADVQLLAVQVEARSRPLASMGMIGAVLVMLAAFLAMFDIAPPFTPISGLLSALIAVFEMLLAGWLILKGFSSPATASKPARTVTNKLMGAA
jgi:hypothetical protein